MFRKFINRYDELDYLNKEYNRSGFSFTVIYGRRRVGKTELINNFIKDKPAIYFMADKRGNHANLMRFRKKSAEFFGEFEPGVEGFDRVFEFIKTKWVSNEKLIIVIDEFSYLAQVDDSIPSVFQLIVDESLKNSRFRLILCGSSVSMMEKSVLAYSSPLYGRRTGQMEVKPVLFRHIQEFFPDVSFRELVNIYGAAGGVPFYLLFFNPETFFYENLKQAYLSKEGVLYAEGEFLLKEELRDPSTYMNILYAVSKGATRPGEIATKSYLEAKDLPYYLGILMKLEFVKKEHPVLDKPVTKKTLYRINDNFLRFWFRYVLTHMDGLEMGDKAPAIEDIRNSYDTYLGETFEQVVKESLLFLNSRRELPFRFLKIGRQWGKIPFAPTGKNDYEINVVAINPDNGDILLCECKWQDKVNAEKLYAELKEKAGFLKWHDGKRQEHYAIFARSFSKRTEHALCFDIEDIGRMFSQQ